MFMKPLGYDIPLARVPKVVSYMAYVLNSVYGSMSEALLEVLTY